MAPDTDAVDGRWLVVALAAVGLGAYALELGAVLETTTALTGAGAVAALALAGAVEPVRQSVCYRCVTGGVLGAVGLYAAAPSSPSTNAWLVAFVGAIVVVRALGDGVGRRLQNA